MDLFRSLLGKKILGYPVRIDNKQYTRNAFYFNFCFVFAPTTRTVVYEPVVRKLTEYMVDILCWLYCIKLSYYICFSKCFPVNDGTINQNSFSNKRRGTSNSSYSSISTNSKGHQQKTNVHASRYNILSSHQLEFFRRFRSVRLSFDD